MPPTVAIDNHGNLSIENFGRNPDIPITFMHDGRLHRGHLSEIMGMGGYHWSLNINGYFRGNLAWLPVPQAGGLPVDLSKPQRYALRFWSHKGDLDYLADEFIDLLIAWYQ